MRKETGERTTEGGRSIERGKNESKSKKQEKNPSLSEDKSRVDTTIQGCDATFVKIRSHTSLFFGGFEEPSEIKEAEFLASYGSKDLGFVQGLLAQLANVAPRVRPSPVIGFDDGPDVEAFKSLSASVRALGPRDPLEAIICSQMVIAHSLAMMFSDKLCRADIYMEAESAELSATRLFRTYSALADALERHRFVVGNWTVAEPESRPSLRYEGKGFTGKIVGKIGSGHGLDDPDFVSSLFGPLTKLGIRSGLAVDPGLWFARAFVTNLAPRDAFKAQVCAQMAVSHSYALYFASRLTQEEDFMDDKPSAERSLNRFLRTFCAQTDMFHRHRMQYIRRNAARRSAPDVSDDIPHLNGSAVVGRLNGHASA